MYFKPHHDQETGTKFSLYMLIITREKPSNAYVQTQFSYGNIYKYQSYSHDDKVKCNMH